MTTDATSTSHATIKVDVYDLPDQQSDLLLELVVATGAFPASDLTHLLGSARETGRTRTLSMATDTEAYFAVVDRGWYVYGAKVPTPQT